jgi:monofunctional biosynthetic peptidoglycan transglycosylase
VKDFLKKLWRFTWKGTLWFLGLSILFTILFRFVPIPITPLMLIRCAENAVDGKKVRIVKDWQSLDKISNHLQLAVVASEDQRFLTHYGFDFEALQKAKKYNEKMEKRKKKKIRGGSTISQQTAKNVFLWHGTTFVTKAIRKVFEVYFTVLIETLWSKERIMEVYLNVIEMGDGIYGAEAASQYYFKHSAAKLSASEAALIAAILPNPRKYSASRPGPYVSKRQGNILIQMGYFGGKLDYDNPPKFDEKD